MRFLILPLLCTPLCAQFITPEWRGNSQTEHAAWDVFTKAKFEPNSPDAQNDIPTNNATITCTTSSAFLTSGGNIYSFQAPTFFQLDDSAEFPIQNIVVQLLALGSLIDLSSARIVTDDDTITPTKSFIINQDALGGEFGGQGTSYAIQWDLSSSPLPANTNYSILFNAAESSLSLDQVSLDTSSTFQSLPEPAPQPPNIQRIDSGLQFTWTGNWILQTNTTLSGTWTEVTEGITTINGVHQFTVNNPTGNCFYRLVQSNNNE